MSPSTQEKPGKDPGVKNLGVENLKELRSALSTGLNQETSLTALDLVLKLIKLRHGAMLAYDPDHQSLSLLADRGLSDEARKAMSKIRRGVPGSWDMPLHSLLQRRVYMVERPKENPFVPTLIEGSDEKLLTNLVFLPLYAGGSARGLLLLIGCASRVVREFDIVSLREQAKLLGEALANVDTKKSASPEPESQPLPPPAASAGSDKTALQARITELEAVVQSLRRPLRTGGTSTESDRQINQANREREQDRIIADLNARETELVSLQSEYDLLQQKNLQESERARKLSGQLAQTREQLTGIAEREQQAGQNRERTDRSHAELEVRLQGLERRLTKSMENAREAQAERATLSMQNAELEAQAQELQVQSESRDSQITDLRTERDRLSSAFEAMAVRAQEAQETLSQSEEDSAEATAGLRRTIEAAVTRAQVAEHEREQIRAAMSGESAVVGEIRRGTEDLSAQLSQEIERRRAAEETSRSVVHDAAKLREEVRLEHEAREQLELSIVELRKSNETLVADQSQLRTDKDTLRKSLRAAEENLSTGEQSLIELTNERAEIELELNRLQTVAEEVQQHEDEVAARIVALERSEQQAALDREHAIADLDTAHEERNAIALERDSANQRAANLKERVEALLLESSSVREERSRAREESEQLREAASTGEIRIEEIEAQLKAQEAEVIAARNTLETAAASHQTQSTELERHIDELRNELETSQTHGSRLTENLESLIRSEQSLKTENSELRSELDQQRERLRSDGEERLQLNQRLQEMEEVLRSAPSDPNVTGATDVDALSMLRSTLERSDQARRDAEESRARLEASLITERAAHEQALAEAEAERQTAGELSAHLETLKHEFGQLKNETQFSSANAEELRSELAGAIETTRTLAGDLGRRSAELEERNDDIRALKTELDEARTSTVQASDRLGKLEVSSRETAAEHMQLRAQIEAEKSEHQELIEQHQSMLTVANTRTASLETELERNNKERVAALENTSIIQSQLDEREQEIHALQTGTAEVDATITAAQLRAENLAAEVTSLQETIETFEQDLRTSKESAERWQEMNDKLQRSIEQRDRDLAGLRGAIATMRKTHAQPETSQFPSSESSQTELLSSIPDIEPGTDDSILELTTLAPVSRQVVIFDNPGPVLSSLRTACEELGFDPIVADGSAVTEIPELIAVNLLAPGPAGLEAIRRAKLDEHLRGRPIIPYAAKPGSQNGLMIAQADCLVQPIEEQAFLHALKRLIGKGKKRVTVIGEELDSVLRLNGWAAQTGCSVSSAGDLKQGSDLLDIVRPDLIVFDFSRLSGEGASLITKVRQSERLVLLPVLIILPEASTSTQLFLKRLGTLAEAVPFNTEPMANQLKAIPALPDVG